MRIRNIFAVHPLSIELKLVQYLIIWRVGFIVLIWKWKLCNSWIRWVDLPLAKDGYLARKLGMYQNIFGLGTQMMIGTESWRKVTQRDQDWIQWKGLVFLYKPFPSRSLVIQLGVAEKRNIWSMWIPVHSIQLTYK